MHPEFNLLFLPQRKVRAADRICVDHYCRCYNDLGDGVVLLLNQLGRAVGDTSQYGPVQAWLRKSERHLSTGVSNEFIHRARCQPLENEWAIDPSLPPYVSIISTGVKSVCLDDAW